MENVINFHIAIPQKQLSKLLASALDKAIGDDSIEVNSLKVVLKRVGEVVVIPEGKKLNLTLPYDVTMRKEAGLFSAEATGAVKLDLDIDYDISSQLRLSSRTTLKDFTWITKPKLEVGIINLPIEKILDLVIRHYEPVITAKVDSKLKEYSNMKIPLTKVDEELTAKLLEVDTKGLYPDFNLTKVELQPITKDDSGFLHLQGLAYPEIKVTNRVLKTNVKDIEFDWIDEIPSEHKVKGMADISYEFITQSILENLPPIEVAGKPLEIAYLDIKENTGNIEIESMILQPIKADVKVNARPIFNEETKMLDLEELNVEVNPSSFIYKMTAPLVNTFIRNKIKSTFPIETKVLLDKYIKPVIPASLPHPYGTMDVKYDDVELEDIRFDHNGVNVDASVKNLVFESTINYEA